MGYPTSPITFTTKIDGVDSVQASHINGLQTEVTAIEQGLLNGLQHALTISTGGLTVSTGVATFGGGAQFQDQVVQRPVLLDYAESLSTRSLSSGALSINLEDGNTFDVTLAANVTSFSIANPPEAGRAGAVTLVLRSGGSTRSFAWSSIVKWASGSTPNLSTGVDVVTLMTTDAGGTWFGFMSGQDFR